MNGDISFCNLFLPVSPFPPLLLLPPTHSAWYFSSGQVLSATQDAVEESYDPEYLVVDVRGQLETRQVHFVADDSYLGECWTWGGGAGGK